MNGYELVERPRCTPYYWREVDPTAESLIEALRLLPADTKLEVQTGPEQVGDPTNVTYWPTRKQASIG
jgi:hypothetical protein